MTDDESAGAPGSDGDGQVEGTSVHGQSASGQSTGGQSANGTSPGGESASGQPGRGQPTDGRSSDGQSTGGQSSGRQPSGGQTGGRNRGQAGGQNGGQAGGQNGGPTGGQNSGQAAERTTGGSAGAQPSDEITGPAAGGTGLEPNVAGAIAYLFAPLTGIVMLLVEGDEDDFVRFHSIQSIGFGAVAIAAWTAVGIVMGILTAIPFVGDIFALLALPLNGAVGLGAFAVWLLLVVKAYQGERYALPVIGPFAASN